MRIAKHIVLVILFFGITIATFAQCAMCKAVAESDLAGGGTAAKGINEGILYLMFIPYILIGGAGYFIYKHYKKNKSAV
tara:strand:- start:3666 stop:3902 length:237 start_codon:yes stop_codon:yes gene_type:complete